MLKVINNFQIMSNNNDTSQDCHKQSSSMRNSVEQLLDQILVQVIQEESLDVNIEQRVRDYAAKQAEREREEGEKKEAKMNKLKSLAEWENRHEFSDPQYDRIRSGTEEKVHDGMEAAMKVESEKLKKFWN